MYKKWENIWRHTILWKITNKAPHKYNTICNICWIKEDKWYNSLDKCKKCIPRTRKFIVNKEFWLLQLTNWEFTKIDIEDYEKIRNYSWYKSIRGSVESRIWWKLKKLHRFILNPNADELIDHIDLDKLNNTRKNLRVCSQLQNNLNKNSNKLSKTGIKNIYMYSEKKYLVQCWYKWKKYWNKFFENLDEAKKYRDILIKEVHWNFWR